MMTEESKTASAIRDQVTHAVDVTRDSMKDAVQRSQQGIAANPLSVLLGGLAVGIVAGSLIPASKREKKVLGPVGKRVNETAAAAAMAARDAGKEQLGLITPDKDSAKAKVGSMLETVFAAAKEAGMEAAKTKPDA